MFRKIVPPQTRAFALSLLLALVFFSLFRLVFYLTHRPLFDQFTSAQILGAFGVGVRFDLHTVSFLFGLFFLLLHLPGGWKRISPLAAPFRWLPAFLMIASFFILMVDINYFNDAGRHLSYEIFTLGTDAGPILATAAHYRWSILAFLLMIPAFLLLWRRIIRWAWKGEERHGFLAETACLVLYLLFLFLAVRGSLGAKPIRPGYAFPQGYTELGHLALNGVYTVGNTLRMGDLRRISFYPEEEAVRELRSLVSSPGTSFLDDRYPLFRRTAPPPDPGRVGRMRPNLVVIILESWSGKFTGATGGSPMTTPRFDALAREGLLLDDFYASGRRSNDGIAAITLGVPSFNDLHIMSGSFEQNSYRGLARILKDFGYSSLFMHGARVGSFGLVGFAGVAGFDRYVGMDDLSYAPSDWDQTWGIWDHVLAERFGQELSRMPEPFLGFWFTLTSHAPFALPDPRYKVTPEGTPDRDLLDSIHYTDDALGIFFEEAQKEPWFANTIFVLVADHTAGVNLVNLRERHHIPCLIYAPGLVPPAVSHRVGSQTDLVPTLLDLAGLPGWHHAFGRSLLPPGREFAFLNPGDGYGWVDSQCLWVVDGNGLNPHALAPAGSSAGDDGDDGSIRGLRTFIQMGRELIRENRLAPNH